MKKKPSNRAELIGLGKRIKEMRARCSISQERLAELADVHRTYIGMIERGEKNVTVLSIQKIASALDISISELFEGFEIGK